MKSKCSYPLLFLSVFFLLWFPSVAFSQSNKHIDSLYNALKAFDAKNKTGPVMRDTIKVHILSELTASYYGMDNVKAMAFANAQLILSQKINYAWGIANALNSKGGIYDYNGDYDRALAVYEQSVAKYIESGDKSYICDVYNNIGVLYSKKGIYNESLKYMLKAVDIAKKANMDIIVMGTYNNIGVLYRSQNKNDMALAYYLKCLEMQKQHKDNYISVTYHNIGELYRLKKQLPEAMKYFELGMKNAVIENNYESIADNNSGIGFVYVENKNYEQGLRKHIEALSLRKKAGDSYGMFKSYISLGAIYLVTGDNEKALSYTQQAMALAKKNNELQSLAEVYQQLSEIYKVRGNYKEAFANFQMYKTLNDSVFNAENAKKLVEQQMNFDFKNIQEKKDEQVKKALQKQKNIRNAGIAGSGLLGCSIVFFLIRRHRRSSQRKQKLHDENLNVLHEELTVKELRNELMALDNEYQKGEREKLQNQLDFNQRELASSTLYLFEKNKLLSELHKELDALPKSVVATTEIENIKSTIQRNLFLDADWEKFRLHFEQVHPNFFEELKLMHPGLTAYEVRLYAYLHMKLATKEIAALLNITPESVIKAKVRLNKKLRKANENHDNGDTIQ